MLHKWNRFLSFLLAIALVTTTFGSDFATAKAYAVEGIETDLSSEDDGMADLSFAEEVTESNEESAEEATEVAEPVEPTEEVVEEPTADEETQEEITEEEASEEEITEETEVKEPEETETVVEEKLVKVTYKAGKGGRVSPSSEEVDINKEDAAFEGSTATAWNDKYTFVDWTDEDGNQVSTDATFVPSDVTEDATFTANFLAAEDIETAMPKISADSVKAGDMIVSVSADAGLFPEGTEIVISAVDDDTAVELAEQSLGEGNVKKAKAVDIKFVKDEQELQPADAKYVHVSMTLDEAIENAEDAVVLHQHDGEVKEIADAEVTAGSAEFDVNQFSVFIYAEENGESAYRVINYVFYADAEKTEEFNTQPVKNGDTLANPGMPKLGNNQEFIKWQIETENADGSFSYTDADFDAEISGIDENTPATVNVVPLIQGTYYTTFYAEKDPVTGTAPIFHVETVIATGTEAATVNISNVPDYTPTEDIMNCIGWVDEDGNKYSFTDTVNAKDVTELWPDITKAYWVRFEKNQSGATFTGAQRVAEGAKLSSIQNAVTGDNAPWCNGYEFLGWATSQNATEPDVDWNLVLTAENTVNNEYKLYGVWKPNAETTYTVVFWTQSINDKYDAETNADNKNLNGNYTWDFSEAVRLKGATNSPLNSSIVNTALNAKTREQGSDWTISRMDGANYTGFQYLTNDLASSTTTISGNGDTVINVYYTRKVVSLTFNYNETETIHHENYFRYSNSDDVKASPSSYNLSTYGAYGLVNGEYVPITFTSDFEVYFTYNNQIYTGALYYYYYRWYQVTDIQATNSNTSYYTQQSTRNKYKATRNIREINVVWYDDNGNVYNGDIYGDNGSSESYDKVVVMKMLYGQTLSQNDYEWPYTSDNGEYYNWKYRKAGSSSNTTKTFLDAVFEDYTFSASTFDDDDVRRTVRFYKETEREDGTVYYQLTDTVKSENTGSFEFTEKYEGYTVTQYSNGENGKKETATVGDSTNYTNLCVYFDRKEYNVTFFDVSPLPDDNNAEHEVKTVTLKYGQSLSGLATTENTYGNYSDYGYENCAWYKDNARKDEFDFSITMPANNLAVYGCWEAVTYGLHLNPNGGTLLKVTVFDDDGYGLLTMNPGEQIFKNELTDSSYVSKEGWDLVGWYYQEDVVDGEPVYGNAFPYEPIKKETYLVAKWRYEDNISIVFDGNGHGTYGEAASTTYSDGNLYASDSSFVAAAAPDNVDKGWTFIGWIVEGDANNTIYTPNAVVAIQENMIDTDNAQVLVKAQYIENGDEPGKVPTFIQYHTNFGADQVKLVTTNGDQPLYVNHPITALSFEGAFPGVTNEHYDFIGWSTSASATVAWLEAGETYTLAADEEDASVSVDEDGNKTYNGNDLYAVWAPKNYTVTFNLLGGTAANPKEVENQTVQYLGTATQPDTEITRAGHTFKGWTLDTATNVLYDFDTQITGDTNLYAIWEKNQYRVTFVSNGDTNPDPQDVYYGDLATKPADPTREGYIFEKWYSDEDLSIEYDFATPVTDNITLYGAWKFDGKDLIIRAKTKTNPYTGVDLVGEAEIVVPEGTTVPFELIDVKYVNDVYSIRNVGSIDYAIASVGFLVTDPTVKAVTTYTLEPGKLTVTPLEISVTSAGETWQFDYQYHSNGNITAVFNGATTSVANGKLDLTTVNGEVITFETKAKRMFLGKEKNVITVSGPEGYEDNYVITKEEGYLVITLSGDKKLTVTAGSTTFTYSGDTYTFDEFTVSGKPEGFDTLYRVEADITGSVKDVTTGNGVANVVGDVRIIDKETEQEVDIADIGLEISKVDGWLKVSPKEVTVTAIAASKTYGAADPDWTKLDERTTVEGLLNGDSITYSVSRAAGENVGTYTITPAGEATQGNYHITYNTANFTILGKAVKVTADDQTKVYGAADPELTWTVEGLVNDADKDKLKVTVTRAEGEGVGEYTITPDGEDVQGNYTVTYETGTLTITKATATVTAEAKTKVYGANDPELTATVTGLVNGDTESAISYTLSRAEGENVGTYTITPSGDAVQGNYDVVYATADLTITKATATVTADAKTKVYGAADPKLTATVTGLQNGDADTVISYTLSRAEGEDVGTYTITPSGDAEQGNYDVVYATGNLTITKATATVTADAKTKVYGSADPELTATVTGLQNGDAQSVIKYSLSRAQGEDVGIYTITPAGDAVQGNYDVVYATGNLTITKATATVTAEAKTKTYGSDDPELTATVTGLQNGDAESVISYTLARVEGEDIGSYAITPSGDAEQGNYDVVFVPSTLTINKKGVVVTADGASKVYGVDDPTFTATVTGLENGDDESVIKYTLSRTEGEDVGDYTITPTGDAVQGNYDVTFVPGTFKITKATATVTAEAKTKVYGADDPELTAVVTGLQNGDDESVIKYSLARATGEDVGTYTITPSGDAEQGNYDVVYATANLTITKATATVTAEAKTKVYGAADPELTATVTGLQNGDDESVISYTLARAEGEDVGTYTITPSGEAVQGNYDVVYETANLTITKATVTVTADAKTKVYGAADPTLTATVTGLQNGDAESVISYTLARAEGEDVGTYTITPAGEAKQGNYDVVYATGNLTITKATATVTADAKTKVYGEADPKLTATVTGLQNGDADTVISYTLSRAEGEDVGTYTITPSGDAEQGNYDVVYATGNLTITKATATVTADAKTKVYGSADPELTATVTGLQNGDAQSVIKYSLSRATGEDVGTYTITPSGDAVQGNYDVVYATGNLTITKATATVTAEAKTKTYGSDDPELTATVTGLQNGDAESVISYTLARVEGEDIGSYAITPSGDAEQGNYDVVFVPSTLTINKKGVVVTADGASKVYGVDDPTFTATVTGLENGDDESVIKYTLSRTEGEDVGDYTITPTGDAVQGNYDVTFVPGTFKITKATATVTAEAKTKVYGADDPELTAVVTGLQNGDDESVISYTLSRAEGENVGTYAITPTGDAVQGNYDVTYVPANLEITKAKATVTADAKTKTYGAADPELTATVTGLQNGDDESVISYTLARAEGEDVGTYTITPTGDAVQGNYDVTYVPANLTINARKLTLTAGSNTTHVFDGKAVVVEVKDGTTSELTEDAGLLTGHEFTYEFDVVNDEKLGKEVASNQRTLAGSQPVIIKEGTVVITADGKDVTKNYDITLADGLIDISSRGQNAYKVTISADDVEITYDGQKHIYTTGYRVEGEGEKVSILEMIWDTIASIFSIKASAADGIEFTVDDNIYVLSGVEVTAEGQNRGTYAFTADETDKKITFNVDGVDADVTDEFTVEYKLGNLIIDPAPATVTANSYSRNTSQSDPTLTAVIKAADENLQAEAEQYVKYNVSRAPGNSVGTYAITATPADGEALEDGTYLQGNFKVTYIPGTLTITAAPSGGGDTPSGPTPIPDEPTPTAAAPAGVLGARREDALTDGAAVLGARRGRTEDEANTTARVFAIVMAAAAAITALIAGKKKEEEEN